MSAPTTRSLRRFGRSDRGTTLLEIMISMAVIMIGMLGLVRVLSVATSGTSTANKFLQAQMRAQLVLEAIRRAPTGMLGCLVSNGSDG